MSLKKILLISIVVISLLFIVLCNYQIKRINTMDLFSWLFGSNSSNNTPSRGGATGHGYSGGGASAGAATPTATGGGGGGGWGDAPAQTLPTVDPAAAAAAEAAARSAAARAATQRNIDAVDTALGSSLSGIDSNFARIMQQYADEEAINSKAYQDNTTQNEQNRSNTIQASLLGAAQGRRGLMATLAALNALGGGTGELLANRAVATEANKDIGEGNRTFDTNATQLVNSYTATQQDEKNRRAEAEAARENQKTAARANTAQQKQSLFEKMAGYWSDAGNSGEAARYLDLVGQMAPQIAQGANVTTAGYTPRSAVFNPGQLKSYLGGANDMTVKTDQGANGGPSVLNSPLYALSRKRDEQLV